MADSFKWIANKTLYPPVPGFTTEELLTGVGFDGWPKIVTDLDVSNYEVVNTYDLEDLVPFYWNWYGFTGQARAQIPLTENSANKNDVDNNISGTYTSDLLVNRDPKDRIEGSGFSYNPGFASDEFDLEDLEDGIENPDYDPNDPNSEYWLREPNDVAQCKTRAFFVFKGINTIYRCFSGGVFIGYSFKRLGNVYAKASLTSGGSIVEFKQKLIGYYGLIEDIDDLLYSYDTDVDAAMQDKTTVVTSTVNIDNGNTDIDVTLLQSTANFTSTGAQNTPEGNASFLVGIDGALSVNASLGTSNFTFHTYT